MVRVFLSIRGRKLLPVIRSVPEYWKWPLPKIDARHFIECDDYVDKMSRFP